MKQTLVALFFLLGIFFGVFNGAAAQKPVVKGPEGKLSYKITLPKGFNPQTDRCPMVILMHGIFASKNINPTPALARGLAKAGIASIRFDFDGHGQSDGRRQDMTIEKEIADAKAIWDFIQTLPYVEGVGLLGHSQGGVVASMTAGRLAAAGIAPMWCSERFKETYGDLATLQVVEGENHTITRHRKEVVASTVAFFKKVFGK